ncbi:MAG: tetratricopeptide repeat-containing sensor histidine kinase [Bacteroidota bacterium]
MKKAVFGIFIFMMIVGNLFSQQSVIDRLKINVPHQQKDTLKIKYLKNISNKFLPSQTDSALFYAQEMLAFAEEKQLLYYISDAYDLISNIYEQKGELENSVVSIDSAKHYANLIDDPVGIMYFATNKGSIYMKMGRYFEALQSFEEVKNIGEEINKPSRVAAALNNIGAVYHYLGDDETSLDYFIQSYDLRVENNLTKKLAYSLNNIGAVYSKYGNFTEALEYHMKALQIAISEKDEHNYLVALINIGLDYDFLNNFKSSLDYYDKALKEAENQGDVTSQAHVMERMSSVFAEEGNIEKAKPLLKKALAISLASGNKYDIASFSNSLGIIYLKEQDYNAALPMFVKALQVAKQINASKIEADVYSSLATYYYSTNNSKEAFFYQKLFDVKRDSLYKAETDLKIANLKNRFELSQKLKELKLKDLELTTEKIISSERLSIIYIVGITVIILLILLLYILFLYRKIWNQKQLISHSEKKVKELLEKEKELGKIKTQLISTVSHEFRTPMAIISSNVQLIRDFNDSMDEAMRNKTVSYISNGVNNMIAMMKNFEILDKTTILEFKPSKINLSQLCRSLSDELQSLPKYGGRILFTDRFSQDAVIMDASLITHIVRNLLINALKFSGEKKVEFLMEDVDDMNVAISISDKGIGMSKFDIEKIFEDFHRGSNAVNIKGTGVGMSVVKRCINLHGGSIEVDSKLNEGTIIKVTLLYEKV